MKPKPAVENELILENVLTLYNEDEGANLRACVLYGEMLEMKVHLCVDDDYKHALLLFTDEQMEQLIILWNEWKDEEL